ncbi:unnamed protein product [Bemisia tabaci]|uniref:Integral membrane protein DGCR2/IDD n=1 Tax=Bemisia tabaci TaxID=7038 RepID=A0A9P0F5U2_BEMTA|nr:unnamed protein product [Bemisia tabaci]
MSLQKVVILGFTLIPGSRMVEETGGCIDINGRVISPGLHYVPGVDTYTLCICDDSVPKSCKAILCTPPQDCKSFRIEKSCCNFECLDDESHDGDIGLRLIACAITVILSLSVLVLLVHKLRQRKTQGVFINERTRQLRPENRAIDFITNGYEEVPVSHCQLWKPHAIYYPHHGEAPPPYEEAVAAAEMESSLGLAFSHRTIPLSLTANVQHLQPASELHTISTSVTPEQPSRLLTYTSYIGLPQRFLTVTPLATTAEPAPIKSMFIKPLGHNVHKLEDKLSPNKETEVRINVTDIGGSGRNSNLATSNTSILGNKTGNRCKSPNPDAIRPPSMFCSLITPIMEEHEETSTELIDPTILIEDGEDYRTECENCNPTLAISQEEYISEPETMTLQRPKPSDDDLNNYFKASLTMPTNYHKMRPIMNHNHVTTVRDSWFNDQESTDESSEE